MPGMRTAIVIPSLGASSLASCLAAAARQTAPPVRIVVTLSGGGPVPQQPHGVDVVTSAGRLGFAASANRGINSVINDVDAVALLNDDAEPGRQWLATLVAVLETHAAAGAVQGTVTTASGTAVDGRGLRFDHYGLPRQVDRGCAPEEGWRAPVRQVGVSATAALFRCSSLKGAALASGQVFDESFDSYHEDADLALRLWRIGHHAYWAPDAPCLHHGSRTGRRLSWRHPWWVLGNRWRALAGNLRLSAMIRHLPVFLRGEIRAVRTLARRNRRVWPVATLVSLKLPLLILRGQIRATPGPRLRALPRLRV